MLSQVLNLFLYLLQHIVTDTYFLNIPIYSLLIIFLFSLVGRLVRR